MIRQILNLKNNQTLLIIILLLLSCAVYINTFQNQFTYDDRPVLLEDHRLRSFDSLVPLFTHDYMMTPDHNLYRPLPMLSIAVNYLLSGEAPWSYRIINLLLHSLNVILLFIFLGNFYQNRPGFRFLASAIFAVHPAATEAVNLIVYRAELLTFMLSIAAFHLYIRRDRGKYFLHGSVTLYFLAMLSKESAMVLPLFLLLYHFYFDRGRFGDFMKGIIGYGLAALLVTGIRYAVLGAFGPQKIQQFFYGIPWLSTAFTMAKALAYYWKIALWPKDLQMNYDFSDFPVASSIFDAWVMPSLVFLTLVMALVFWLYKKDRTLSYFVVWPFIAFLPVMNIIVPTGVLFAVRLMYLPMAGYSVALAALLLWPGRLLEKLRHVNKDSKATTILFAYLGAVLIVLSSLTLIRNADFKDSITLFKKDLKLSPRNILAIKFLAPDLPPDEAEALLIEALKIMPSDSAVLALLGEVYEKKGNYVTAESLLRYSLRIESTHRAHKQLGIVLSNTGRFDEAEEHFRKVIELKPFWSNAYEDLAIVLYKKGDLVSGFEMSQKALRLNPDSAAAYNLIGTYYKEIGAFDKAAGAFQKSIKLSQKAEKITPVFYAAMYNLADTEEKTDPAMAVRTWEKYVRVAEKVASEKAWVEKAKKRIAALSKQGNVD